MIEAVNSTIANAALVRGVAEQSSVGRVQSPSPAQERREISVPQAPYVSPYIKVDTQFDTAVLQIRDSDTGDVIDQFPRETTLAARQREQVLREIELRRVEQGNTVVSSNQTANERSNATQASAFLAQQTASATSAAPSSSDAQLASVAFTTGASSSAASSSQAAFSVTA